MKGFLKSLMTLAGLVLIAIGAAAFFAQSRGEAYLKAQGEQRLSKAFDAAVSIDRVRICLYRPEVAFEGVHIGDPRSFPEGEAAYFGRVRVAYDPHTLGLHMPYLTHVHADGVTLHVQSTADRGSNIQRLLDNEKRFEEPVASAVDMVAVRQIQGEEAEIYSQNQSIPPAKTQAFTLPEVSLSAKQWPEALAGLILRTYTGAP